MYNVYDNYDKEYGIYESLDKAYFCISMRLKEIGFKSYYYRETSLEDNIIWIDYGSHTHFFYIKKIDQKGE